MSTSKKTPILIIIFNRESVTRQLIQALRDIKPDEIFVVADGPRKSKSDELEKCQRTRNLINTINWPCLVHKKYFSENQGCDKTVEIALNWFFENVDSGIILEDDCIPNQSFFDFCSTMLQKHADNTSIMHINGSNFQFGQKRGDGSYYFSKYAHSWGWATWKRAWKFYDHNLTSLSKFKKNNTISNLNMLPKEKTYWLSFFDKLQSDKYPFWDSRWIYAIWSNNGKCITPNYNLIENIGWDKDATHTNAYEKISHRKVETLETISDPDTNEIDARADIYTFRSYYYRSIWQKISYKLHQYLK